MDYISGLVGQNIAMDKYSTEILSKTYSELSQQEEPPQDGIEHYYMTEMDSREAEACSKDTVNSKINISKATAHLSAQVMNLPFDKFKESISKDVAQKSKKFTYDEYDIFKKIREAYDACACKICKCLTGTVISPQMEFCDCEPCKCKDCTLNSNLRINSPYFRSSAENKMSNKINHVKSEERRYTKCDCKPCDCIECSQHSSSLGIKPCYRTQNGMKANKINAHDYYPTHDTSIGFNKFSNCSRATWINDACKTDTTNTWATRSESLSDERNTNASNDHSPTLNNNLPISPVTVYQSHSNKKCVCRVCECIACECKGNDLTCKSIKPRNLENADFCKCATCRCQFCSHKNQTTLKSIERFKCKCDFCSCLQCDRNSERKSGLNKIEPDIPTFYRKKCNRAPCECSVCELGIYDEYGKKWCEDCGVECKTTGDNAYPIKYTPSISRMMRENPLTYECNEYKQIIKSRIQSNATSREKTKHGNVYYVTSRKTCTRKSSNTISSLEKCKVKDNKLNITIHNNTNIGDKKRHFGNTVKIATTHQNSQISKNPSKDVAVTAVPGEQVNNMHKTDFKSFYSGSGSRSTQTILKSSSSSCQNNGHCTHVISLPNTSSRNSYVYSTRENNYEIHPNIYHCSNISNKFNENNTATLVHIHQNNYEYYDVGTKVNENFSCDSLEKNKSNSRNAEEIVKADYVSVSATLQKAKQFTLDLTKILHEYEKANTEFDRISKKVINSRHVVFNRACNYFDGQICEYVKKSQSVCHKREVDIVPNEVFLKINHSCSPITNHRTAVEEKDSPVKLCQKKESLTECFKEITSDDMSNYNGSTCLEVASTNTKTLATLNNHNGIKERETKTKTIPNITNNSQIKVEILCDNITSIDKSQVLQSCINEQKNATSKVELLRTKKIQNILKQNMMSDPFTERVSSPKSTPMIEIKENFTFNYHTKTLVKSTVPSVVLHLHIVDAKVQKRSICTRK